MFDPGTMRKRFKELEAKRAALLAEIAPVEVERDALIAAHNAAIKPLEAKLKTMRAPLFDLDNERGMIARALNGKTG